MKRAQSLMSHWDSSIIEAYQAIKSNDLVSLKRIFQRFDSDIIVPEQKSKCKETGESLLYAAVIARYTDIIAFLLSMGANPQQIHLEKDNQTPIDRLYTHVMIESRGRDIYHLQMCLLDKRINANLPLGSYLQDPNINTMKLPLHDNDESLIASGKTPLMCAAEYGFVEAVSYLLVERNANPLLKTEFNESAILNAFEGFGKKQWAEEETKRYEDIIRILMIHGVDIESVLVWNPVLRPVVEEISRRERVRYASSTRPWTR